MIHTVRKHVRTCALAHPGEFAIQQLQQTESRLSREPTTACSLKVLEYYFIKKEYKIIHLEKTGWLDPEMHVMYALARQPTYLCIQTAPFEETTCGKPIYDTVVCFPTLWVLAVGSSLRL